MKDISIASPDFLAGTPKPTRLERLARRAVLRRLAGLQVDRIRLVDDRGERSFGKPGGLDVALHVHDPSFYADVAYGGTIGGAEAYIRGYWSCSELTSLVRILLRNRSVLEDVDSGTAYITRPLQKLFHWLNRNTRSGSRRNIAAHYDLGNAFFRLWLDERMMYSSAIFERPDMTLDEASEAKLERICGKLNLRPGDRVIEIGSGWGGFAIHAASRYGCHVTTTTISREQHALAAERVREAGLDGQVTLLLQDYRDLQGRYDKLVSIEMFEAVGHEYHPAFFRKCADLLAPDGMLLLQTITIADQRYERARRSVDFIQRYIFPGGALPSVTSMAAVLTRHTDLRITHVEDIGPHYATTLRMWRERFFDRIAEIRDLGYPEEFIRMWEYYLCYCEGAFDERAIGDVQLLAIRPGNRQSPFLV